MILPLKIKYEMTGKGVPTVMRVNEYNTLDEFINEYTGIWDPSEGHWFGLDFKYDGVVYRLNTGSMYNESNTILLDGRTAIYGLYQSADKAKENDRKFVLLGEYADMNDLLESEVIQNQKFSEIIMNDSTEILGKD